MNGSKTWLVALVTALMALVSVACGDDGGGGSVAEYCEASAELDGEEELPSDEQFDELADLAPEEIADDVELVVEEFKELGVDIFEEGSEEAFEAFERIEEFEQENCTDASDDASDASD